MRDMVLVPPPLPSTAGVSALLSLSNLNKRGVTLGCWGLMRRGKGALHWLSCRRPQPSRKQSSTSGCCFTLTPGAALLGESSRSVIAQASSPTPLSTWCAQPKHRHTQKMSESVFSAKSLPPRSLPRCCLRGSGAILKLRFPGVKSQHLNSECQCSILLSATRLDCRPARESGLVAHWVTSHLFSSILCCHKFIPARCG